MSTLDLPRPPAFAELRPQAPAFDPVEPALAKLIAAVVDQPTTVVRLVPGDGGASGTVAGYYRVDRRDRTSIFLKVIPRSNTRSGMAAADRMVARLPADCPVSRLLPGWPRAVDANNEAFAYEFVDGRFAGDDKADMVRIGRAIARLHAALAGLGEAPQIRDRTAKRLARLERTRRAVVACEIEAGPTPSRVAAAAAGRSLDFDGLGQPLHGDLNRTNILLEKNSDAVFVLDFEDALHTYGPVTQDLALVLERFCLSAPIADERASALSCWLLESYAEVAGGSCLGAKGDLFDALAFVNVRALCVLVELESYGEWRAPGEWMKFLDLLEKHERRRDLIGRIEDACR